jgi:hypothetical protein
VKVFGQPVARSSVIIKALPYKPEGSRFETRWCKWFFSIYLILPAILGWRLESAVSKELQRICWPHLSLRTDVPRKSWTEYVGHTWADVSSKIVYHFRTTGAGRSEDLVLSAVRHLQNKLELTPKLCQVLRLCSQNPVPILMLECLVSLDFCVSEVRGMFTKFTSCSQKL